MSSYRSSTASRPSSRPSSVRDSSNMDGATDSASIRSLLWLSKQIGEDSKSCAGVSVAPTTGAGGPGSGMRNSVGRSPSPIRSDAAWFDAHACEALANCIKSSKSELSILAEMLDLTTADVLRKLKGGVRELLDVAKKVQEKVETA